MIKEFIETFRKPSAKVIAQRDLENAQREHLNWKAAEEYAANTARYHEGLIKRLTSYLNTAT